MGWGDRADYFSKTPQRLPTAQARGGGRVRPLPKSVNVSEPLADAVPTGETRGPQLQVALIAQRHGFPYAHEHIAYDDAGHMIAWKRTDIPATRRGGK